MKDCSKHVILLATSNKRKIDQYKGVLNQIYPKGAYRPFIIRTLTEAMIKKYDLKTPEENGNSTAVNALIKAEYYAQMTGMITISDDGGFFVDDLGGKPGLRAHRDNCGPEAILTSLAFHELNKKSSLKRRARYVTSVACCKPSPISGFEQRSSSVETCTLHGKIADPVWVGDKPVVHVYKRSEPYGYDGIFIPFSLTDSFERTVDTLLHTGKTRLEIGYPRAVAFHSVFSQLINELCPF